MSGLNKSTGNMYEFVTHTWNTVKGECPHNCSYCYMKRWGKQSELHFDEKELKTDLGKGNFIFVGSSCDMFAEDVPDEWIRKTLRHCQDADNKYLFQTKNPARVLDYIDACVITDKSVVCTTIESDICYPDIMGQSPLPGCRWIAAKQLSEIIPVYVTIEPILQFGEALIEWMQTIKPVQVNIGADSGRNGLPEPSVEELRGLIAELSKFTKVVQKKNLKRITGEKIDE